MIPQFCSAAPKWQKLNQCNFKGPLCRISKFPALTPPSGNICSGRQQFTLAPIFIQRKDYWEELAESKYCTSFHQDHLISRSNFKGVLWRIFWWLFVNTTFKCGLSSMAQHHQRCSACTASCCRRVALVVSEKPMLKLTAGTYLFNRKAQIHARFEE